MNAAAIVILTVFNQGIWFGGQTGNIAIQWNKRASHQAALVDWKLMHDGATLAAGETQLAAEDKPANVSLRLPEVRAETRLIWSYAIHTPGTEKPIAENQVAIHLYPNNLLKSLPQRLSGTSLAVWDRADGLPAILSESKAPFTRVPNEASLHLSKLDMLIVGADQIADQPFAQSTMLHYVENGTAALVLRQTRLHTLAGYPVVQRQTSRIPTAKESTSAPPTSAAALSVSASGSNLVWREHEPLLQNLLTRPVPAGENEFAIRLPPDEPALEMVYWPRESPADEPVAIDALVVAKSLGRGKLLLCQVPLGSWKTDPIAQLFLSDAIDYLKAPVEPTLPPSRRSKALKVEIVPPRESHILNP